MARKPIWRLVRDGAHELTAAGRTPFTRSDIVERVQRIAPGVGRTSIDPVIQGVTENLQGGAPGAVGKNILRRVARGRFVLASVDTGEEDDERIDRAADASAAATDPGALPASEGELRDILVSALGKQLPGVELQPEGRVDYHLPSGRRLSHASDILATKEGSGRVVSVEIKYRSAVTDQFKCRAYDAAHMKAEHGTELLTVMLFAKADRGISVERARDICHAFDRFHGDRVSAFLEPDGLRDLAADVKSFLDQR